MSYLRLVDYSVAAADELAAVLRQKAYLIQTQVTARANLRSSLLADCWQGTYRSVYEDDFRQQSARADELISCLISLANQITDITATAQADELRALRTLPPSVIHQLEENT